MKRPLAYVTAAWCGSDHENTKLAAQYCRTVYEAGFSPTAVPVGDLKKIYALLSIPSLKTICC